VCSSCTTPMYINHVHKQHAMCQKISSMECINHMPLPICQHVHLPICQPCASTNMPTMCIYQDAKQCIISFMICLHHEPSTITMYQTNTNCCANQVIPMVYYHPTYAMYYHLYQVSTSIMHQYQNMTKPHTCVPNPP
jgi:hypothetical protein